MLVLYVYDIFPFIGTFLENLQSKPPVDKIISKEFVFWGVNQLIKYLTHTVHHAMYQSTTQP